MKKIFLRAFRIFRTLILILSVLVFVLSWLISLPVVQNKLIGYAERILSSALDTRVEIKEIGLTWPLRAYAKDFTLFDKQNQVFVHSDYVWINMLNADLFTLVARSSKETSLGANNVVLENAVVNLYKSRKTGEMNIAFLSGGEKKDSTSPGRIHLAFPHLRLVNAKFSYVDSTRNDSALVMGHKVNFSNLHLEKINGRLNFSLSPRGIIRMGLAELSFTEPSSGFITDKFSGQFTYGKVKQLGDRTSLVAERVRFRSGATDLAADFGIYPVLQGDSTEAAYRVAIRFDHTSVNLALLNKFVPRNTPLNGSVVLDGLLTGTEREILSDSFEIMTHGNTRMIAGLRLTDYTTKDLRWKVDFAPNSQLNFDELQAILEGANIQLRGLAKVEGKVTGNLADMHASQLKIAYANNTFLEVRGDVLSFSTPDELSMTMKFSNSYLDFFELKSLLPLLKKKALPPELDKLGRIAIDGRFTGGLTDFAIKVDFITSAGGGHTDLKIVLPAYGGRPEFKGELVTQNLNVDKLGISKVIKSANLNFTGSVEGKGFVFEESEMALHGQLVNSDLWGFRIDSVFTDSLGVDSGKVYGKIIVRDKQGNASFLAKNTNLVASPMTINIVGDVDRFDIHHYFGMPAQTTLLTSFFNIKLTGDSLDNFTGRATVNFAELINPADRDTLNIPNISLRAIKNSPDVKKISFTSPAFNADLDGFFSIAEGVQWVDRIAEEARIYVQEKDSAIKAYYGQKVMRSDTLSMKVKLVSGPELSRSLAFFKVPLKMKEGSEFSANLTSAKTDEIKLEFASDSLAWNSMKVDTARFNFTVFKDAMHNNLLGSGELTLAEIRNGSVEAQKIKFEPTVADNSVEYWITGRQDKFGNKFRFNGETVFLSGGIVSRINPNISVFEIQDQKWKVSQRNKILYSNGEILVNDFKLTNGEQTLSASGVLSDKRTDKLIVAARGVPVPDVLKVLTSDLKINGVIDTLTGTFTSLLGEPNVQIKGLVKDFAYSKIDSVDIEVDGYWESRKISEFLALRTKWKYEDQTALIVKGYYDMKKELLNFRSDSSSIPLDWLSNLLEPNVSNLRGKALVDNFTIGGSPRAPQLNGVIKLKSAGAKINFLGNDLHFEDMATVKFNNDSIYIPDTRIYDEANNTAHLSGAVYYAGGTTRLNLLLNQFRDFTMLKTTKKENELFYGHAIASEGFVRIHGGLSKAEITADVKTAKGTYLDIPVSDYTSKQRLDFVHFRGEVDEPVAVGPKLAGFDLNLLVRATEDAKIKLIFDEQVGDLIEATGSGNINLIINNEGEFQMYGQYDVTEGNYMFTAENILNKKFNVKEDGRITWNGLPYDAEMKLDAVYTVNASLSDLLGSSNSGRIPVDIIMHLRGSLASPVISLELLLDDVTQQDVAGLGSYFRNIQYDEQELNRQVVSLLMFRRFAPRTQYFEGSGGSSGGITSSISELISNQLNYWLSQAVNTNLGVQINTTDFEDVQLGLKASLFNERVTIERNGTIIGNRTGQVSIGDVSVLIKLLPAPAKEDKSAGAGDSTGTDSTGASVDTSSGKSTFVDPRAGQLVLEIFNRENAGLNNTFNNTTGGGIFFKKDFDRLIEIFGKKEENEIK